MFQWLHWYCHLMLQFAYHPQTCLVLPWHLNILVNHWCKLEITMGLNQNPWGMPVFIIDGLDSLPFTQQDRVLFDRYDYSQRCVPFPLFHKLLFCLRVYCGRQYQMLFSDPEIQSPGADSDCCNRSICYGQIFSRYIFPGCTFFKIIKN
jgi:hypothetical protein